MNEEIITKTDQEMAAEELGRLYELLETQEPGTEEYSKTLSLIEKIQRLNNESFKIEQVYVTAEASHKHEEAMQSKELKQRKFEQAVKIGEVVLKTASTMLMSWVVLKTNIKFGSISTKEAWNMIFRKS